jgi:hypothetical protein
VEVSADADDVHVGVVRAEIVGVEHVNEASALMIRVDDDDTFVELDYDACLLGMVSRHL